MGETDITDHDRIVEMHTLLTGETGLMAQTKRNTDAICGNGKMGLQTKVLLLFIGFSILALTNPYLVKAISMIKAMSSL